MEKDPMQNKDNAGEKVSRRLSKTTPANNGEDLPLDGEELQLTGEDLLLNGEDLQQSKDKHIDQDLPGNPNAPSKGEIISTGSAGAFEATENTIDDADSDEDNDDLAMGHSPHY